MLKRMISLFLCAAMIVTMLPAQAIALETEEPTEEMLITDPTEEIAESVEEETDPTEEVTEPVEETEPAEEVTEPVEEETTPMEETIAPVEEETVPTEEMPELDQTGQEPMQADGSVIDSGTCGNDLTWTLDDEGTLTISGTGSMTSNPWSNRRSSIKKVIIESGVTAICDSAFSWCSSMTSVTIPDSVVKIGYQAFYYCSGLTSVTIPDSVTYIDEGAFMLCTGLTSVVIPDGITAIRNTTFATCSSLSSVTIPDTVVSIGAYAFSYCTSLSEIYYSGTKEQWTTLLGQNTGDGNEEFQNVTEIIFTGADEEPVVPDDTVARGTCGKNLEWVLNEGGTLTVSGTGQMYNYEDNYVEDHNAPWYSFRDSIVAVVIGDGVTSIGVTAFENCSSMTSIVIPASVTVIKNNAFSYCNNLRDVYFSGTEDQWADLLAATNKSTNQPLFNSSLTVHCNWTEGSEEPEELPTLPEGIIAEGTCGPTATWKLSGAGTLTISGTGMVTEAPWYDDYHAQIKNVTVADGITSICEYAFADCTNLMKVTMPASVDQISVGAFSNCTGITSAGPIGSGADYEFGWTTSIPSGAFCYMSGLSKITWPDGLTSIGDSAFLLCGFTKVVIPEGVKTIGDKAFADCASLKRLAIPSTADSVGEYAFLNCAQLEDVFIMSKSITIGKGAFMEASAISNVFCAVSERNMEKIVLMEGNDPLINAEKFYDWESAMEAAVLVKYNGNWHNLMRDDIELSLNAKNRVDITVILGMRDQYDDAVSFAFQQNGQNVLGDTFRYEGILLSDFFVSDMPVYAIMMDSDSKVLYQEKLLLQVEDTFYVSYNYGDGMDTDIVSYTCGMDIEEPTRPVRDGYVFKGWYLTEECKGIEFFSSQNTNNRIKLSNNITLYAKWVESRALVYENPDGTYNYENIWGFANSHKPDGPFDPRCYKISSHDLNALLNKYGIISSAGILMDRNEWIEGWEGSCFGMASSTLLAFVDTYRISDFTDKHTLREVEKDDPSIDAVESMINFYQLNSGFGTINGIRENFDKDNESENLKQIVEKMGESDNPVVLTISLLNGKYGHAVVAYDFQKVDNVYSFMVYDNCDIRNMYPVTVTENNGIYTAECSEWETEWKGFLPIFFKTCLSVEELLEGPVLERPGTVRKITSDEGAAERFTLKTNYGDFTITNGDFSAKIMDGMKTAGDLDIECIGGVGQVGFEYEYLYYLPKLNTNETYTIIQENEGECITKVWYDSETEGFLVAETAETPGILTVCSDGSLSTQYESETTHRIWSTYADMSTPWYVVNFDGSSTGFDVYPVSGNVAVSSKTETVIDVEALSDFNSTAMSQIPISAEATSIQEGDNRACVIMQNGEQIADAIYGYSVAFDSLYGTNVDAITNILPNTLISEPVSPTKTGYIFAGWFKDAEYTEAWDFATDTVTEDLVLYAGWSVDPDYMKSVTFRVSGMDDQIVYMPVNSLIPVEYAPTASDGGAILWYTDRACTEPWNFETDTLTGSVILYGQVDTHVENRLTVDSAELDGHTSAWIDGREFVVKTVGDIAYMDLPNANAKTMVTYTYQNADDVDVHTHIPTGMKVWTLSNTDGIYTATRVEELDDMLTYAGCSIRVKGNQGIRMITSIDQTNKDALTAAGLAGYTLEEYGTAIAWASQLGTTKPLTLGKSYVSSNYAYKKDVADPIFNSDGNVMQYTNVLVGFTLDQCSDDIAMRPYMILKGADGNEITLYGGIVKRSIGYIAQQNQDIYAEGTEEYAYIMNIINHVYGEDNPV